MSKLVLSFPVIRRQTRCSYREDWSGAAFSPSHFVVGGENFVHLEKNFFFDSEEFFEIFVML